MLLVSICDTLKFLIIIIKKIAFFFMSIDARKDDDVSISNFKLNV